MPRSLALDLQWPEHEADHSHPPTTQVIHFILRYYPGICLKGLQKNQLNLSQDSQSPGTDLKKGPSKYKQGVLTTRS
jgi:hypothetical protein